MFPELQLLFHTTREVSPARFPSYSYSNDQAEEQKVYCYYMATHHPASNRQSTGKAHPTTQTGSLPSKCFFVCGCFGVFILFCVVFVVVLFLFFEILTAEKSLQ